MSEGQGHFLWILSLPMPCPLLALSHPLCLSEALTQAEMRGSGVRGSSSGHVFSLEGFPVPTSSPWCLFTTLLEAGAGALLSEIFEQLRMSPGGGPPAQGQVPCTGSPSGGWKNMVFFCVSHL